MLLVSRFVLSLSLTHTHPHTHTHIWYSVNNVHGILNLSLLSFRLSVICSECWSTFWDMECWCSWPNFIEWSQWGEKRLVMAEVVLQGFSSNIYSILFPWYARDSFNFMFPIRSVSLEKPWVFIRSVGVPLLSGFRDL